MWAGRFPLNGQSSSGTCIAMEQIRSSRCSCRQWRAHGSQWTTRARSSGYDARHAAESGGAVHYDGDQPGLGQFLLWKRHGPQFSRRKHNVWRKHVRRNAAYARRSTSTATRSSWGARFNDERRINHARFNAFASNQPRSSHQVE